MIAHKLLYNDKKDYSFMCMELLLAVMICVYNDNSCFSKTPINIIPFDKIFTPLPSTNRPAFADFFVEKFTQINFTRTMFFERGIKYYSLPSAENLYAAIIYSWCNMHELNKDGGVDISNSLFYNPIAKNPGELKKICRNDKNDELVRISKVGEFMSYDYSENILVQESAGNLLRDELGWDVQFAYNKEVLGKNGTFGRTSYKEILLKRYFNAALKKFNPWINDEQILEAQRILENRLSTSSLLQINEEKYFLIRDGIKVTVKKPNGETEKQTAALIDFKNPQNNYFLAVKELKIHGDLYRRRTDIVGFVNGIPLLFVELKKTTVDVQNAYEDNYTDYQDTIPHLFYYNAFVMLSNGTEAKVGTLGSKYEFFHEWKRLAEAERGSVALETMLRGICKKENFLDLFENFILFDHSGGNTAKILARNHQYLGVNEAMKAYAARKLNNGKLGVFWHTQGSGKSYSMVFLAQKIRRKFEARQHL